MLFFQRITRIAASAKMSQMTINTHLFSQKDKTLKTFTETQITNASHPEVEYIHIRILTIQNLILIKAKI